MFVIYICIMGVGDIYVYIKGNTTYSIQTKKILIYNGIVTTPIVKSKIVGNYQISVTSSGSVYVTVPFTISRGDI